VLRLTWISTGQLKTPRRVLNEAGQPAAR